eukprot:3974883-Prymnesium_polylepis.1
MLILAPAGSDASILRTAEAWPRPSPSSIRGVWVHMPSMPSTEDLATPLLRRLEDLDSESDDFGDLDSGSDDFGSGSDADLSPP